MRILVDNSRSYGPHGYLATIHIRQHRVKMYQSGERFAPAFSDEHVVYVYRRMDDHGNFETPDDVDIVIQALMAELTKTRTDIICEGIKYLACPELRDTLCVQATITYSKESCADVDKLINTLFLEMTTAKIKGEL